jgi:hypothetical protein
VKIRRRVLQKISNNWWSSDPLGTQQDCLVEIFAARVQRPDSNRISFSQQILDPNLLSQTLVDFCFLRRKKQENARIKRKM